MQHITDVKILVFSSNIDTPGKADAVQQELMKNDSITRVTVDLEDRENVLRLECCSSLIQEKDVEKVVHQLGFECAELCD